MKLFQVCLIIFLLYEADLKAVNQKYDIFPRDSKNHYEYSKNHLLNQRKQYVPLIDGEPIIIPEEFAEPDENLDFEKDNLNDKTEVKIDNSDIPTLEKDEVFLADKKSILKPSKLKYPQKAKENDLEPERKKDLEISKPYKIKKICKVSPKNKIKNDTKEQLTNTKNESQNILNKIDSSKKVRVKTSQNMSDVSNSRSVVDDFFETDEHLTLQEEVKGMFGPSFRSFVFNPLAPTQSKFQECNTSKNESGVCRYVQHCFLPSIVSSVEQFMNNVCIIERRFIGVCCPEFPVHSVMINWKDGQQSFNDENAGAKTPEECGVGTNTRIVGGSNANVKAYPWMVALLNNKKEFFCGGALINNRYVLTAAHCTFGLKNDEMIARVGEYDLRNEEGEDYRIVEMKRHGQYNSFTLRNDIALLKLEKPVSFNEFVKVVCFPNDTANFTGKIATLAGWGRLKGGISPFTSDILQEVDFPIVTNEECSSTHGLPIPESLICTSAPSKDKSACNGDSGGPLMMLDNENRWKVVGIVSWGRRGCNTKFPSVFTRVTHYLDWIKHYAV